MIERTLADWVHDAHLLSKSKGFHDKEPTVETLAMKVALMHSELSELLEALRKDPKAPCLKCPAITAEEEEVADLFIRLADYCGSRGIDLGYVASVKHEFNKSRPHMHGRKF